MSIEKYYCTCLDIGLMGKRRLCCSISFFFFFIFGFCFTVTNGFVLWPGWRGRWYQLGFQLFFYNTRASWMCARAHIVLRPAGGGFQVFPPPSTPPEPAPPDRGATVANPPSHSTSQVPPPPRWQLLHGATVSSSLPTASSHTSLDEAACMDLILTTALIRF